MVLPSLVIRARYECSSCDFNLDLKCASSVCSDKRPRTLSHSLHPKHPRRLTFAINIDKCNVCSENRDYSSPVYVCEMCSFSLDFHCAKLSPSLKLDCHHHLLTFFKYFNKEGEEGQDSYSKACGKHCDRASVYRCVQCHFSLHLKCVVPSSATPHIQCILDEDKVTSGKVPSSSPPPMENKALFVEQNEGTNSLFRLIIHRHQMYEVTEELKGENYCRGCRLLEILVANVWSDNSSLQLQATTRFTELLSIGEEIILAPIEEVIQAGVVPRFVELLDSLSDSVREQAVLALGNITGDSLRCRDLVLGHGALLPLLALFNKPAKLVLPPLARLIHSNDDEVLTDACWALSYLSDGTNDKIQAVTEAGVCGRLKSILFLSYFGWFPDPSHKFLGFHGHPSPSVITPALYMVRNIVSGDDVQTQCVISHQALPCLVNLLTNNYEKRIKNVACWTISNITAGNEEQIQVVIEPWVHLLQNAEFDIKKQAAWAIKNATSGGTHDQIKFLVSQGCIKPLCDLLSCPDPEVVTVCLQGLENILKVGEVDKNMGTTGGVNLYAQMIDDVRMNLVGHKARKMKIKSGFRAIIPLVPISILYDDIL
ncbi:hypothetical protein GOBAR_DD05598 [Gossypium barbadense]|nr:hypothetical protein GOBAR_DD05598 [Gossypium barbadense]